MSMTVSKKDADRVVAAVSAYADSRDARIAELEAALMKVAAFAGSEQPLPTEDLHTTCLSLIAKTAREALNK